MDGPISLDDARSYMRIITHDDDEAIRSLIQVAARQIETVYGVVSIQRAAIFSFDCFQREIRIPLIPVKPDSITISYVDSVGVEQSFEDFRVFERHDWTWLSPAVNACWPRTAPVPAAITITATVGHIDPEQPEDNPENVAPADVQQGARLLVEHLYLRTGGPTPPGLDDLVDHYRYRRV